MWTLIRVLRWILAHLPPAMVDGIARLAGWLWFTVVPIRRGVALENVGIAFPEMPRAERRRIVRQSMQNLIVNFLDLVVFTTLTREQINERVAWEGWERFDEALADGGGAIVIAAHLNNWEMEALSAGCRGMKVVVAVREPKAGAARKFIDQVRDLGNFEAIPPRGSVARLLEASHEPKTLASVVADQSQSRRRGIFIRFFGHPACTTPGPAILAERSERPVLPVFIWRVAPQRYLAKVFPPVELDDLRGREDFIPQATIRMNAIFETMIRERPGEYLWAHRRFKVKFGEGDVLHEAEPIQSEPARVTQSS